MKHAKILHTAATLLCLLTLISSLSGCNSFEDTEYAIVSEGIVSGNGFIYDKYENNTVRITGLDTEAALLEIPQEIDGMPVVEIADRAFEGNLKLVYLKIPAGKVKLGKGFCAGCAALTVVELSGSVSKLPDSAFEECRNLTVITGLGELTEIGGQAFADCVSLSSIDFPSTLQSIGAEAFRGCTSLPCIELPESMIFIGEAAFWGCSSLAKAVINGNTSVPKYAFLSCISLTEVIVGDGVELIGEEAFRGCSALYAFKAGKNINTIEDYAFHACDKLTQISFAGNTGKIALGDGNESLKFGS
jgi:hypothetical protein